MVLSGTQENLLHILVKKPGSSREGPASLALSSSSEHPEWKPGSLEETPFPRGHRGTSCQGTASASTGAASVVLLKQEHLLQILAPAPFL